MDVSVSVVALRFIQGSRLERPCIKISLDYKPPICMSSFCRKRPYVSVNVADESSVQEGFVRVASYSRTPVYMAQPLFDLATREGKPVKVDTRGLWKFKRLVLEGLDPYKI
mgnify:CR=1 FL=1